MDATRRAPRPPVRPALALVLTLVAVLGPGPRSAGAEPIDDKRRQAAAIADQLDALAEQMNTLGEDYSEALATQDDLGQEIDAAAADVAAAEASLAQMRGTLYLSAVTRFMNGGHGSTLGTLLASSGGLQDSLQREQLTSIALNQGALTTDSLDASATELSKKKEVLEKKRKQAEAVARSVLQRQGATESLIARYEQLQSSVQGDLVDLLREERQRRDAADLERSQRESNQFQSKYSSLQARYKNLPKVSARSQVAINAALKQLGTPYRYAMSRPGVAFDCSGLTTYAWGRAGVGLPRNSRAQYNALPKIPKSLAMPGDLVFTGSPIHHVGIYLGGGTMVHAPRYGDVVKVSPVRWWKVIGVVRPG
ncbi:MAG: NlpC/P60 family protein [Acidimicrobiales bacterium]